MRIKADDLGAHTEGVYEENGKWYWVFKGKTVGPFDTQEEAEEDLRSFDPSDIEGAKMGKYESYDDYEAWGIEEELKASIKANNKENAKKKEEIMKDVPKNDLDVGKDIEKEHKPTIEKIQEYLDVNGELPPEELIYEWIALDHIDEHKNYYNDKDGLPEMERRLTEMEKDLKEKVNTPKDIESMNAAIDVLRQFVAIKAILLKPNQEKLKVIQEKIKAKLVQRDKDGEKHWALISKNNNRVLKWFGKKKPSPEQVKKAEARVQMFKHMNGFKIKADGTAGDLNVGDIYDKDLLESQGYQFGWEGKDKAVVWEPDGDGWFMEKQSDGSYKCVKQYYEGTEEKDKRRKYMISKKTSIETYLANAIKEYLKKQNRPQDIVEVTKYDTNEIEAIVGDDIEYFTYDELEISHAEIEDLMAESSLTCAKVEAYDTDPAIVDDIEKKALRLAYRFKAEIKEIMRRYKNPTGEYDKAVKIIIDVLRER